MLSAEFQTYAEFRPTAFDSHINIDDGDESREHWYVAPVSQTRDSGALDRVNFSAALKILGGESETVEVHRFGHWGPGWFEIILIDPADAAAVKAMQELTERLEDYPVLDEDELSQVEYDEACSGWKDYGASDLCDSICEAFEISKYSAIPDRLRDYLKTEEFWQKWMNTANAPYESMGDGPSFTSGIRYVVKEMDRDDLAGLLQRVRKWEQRAVLTWEVAPA